MMELSQIKTVKIIVKTLFFGIQFTVRWASLSLTADRFSELHYNMGSANTTMVEITAETLSKHYLR